MTLKCGCNEHSKKYSCKYDAFYCEECNKWLDKPCGCAYCMARPQKPMMPVRTESAVIWDEAANIPIPEKEQHICFKEGIWNNFLRSLMID